MLGQSDYNDAYAIVLKFVNFSKEINDNPSKSIKLSNYLNNKGFKTSDGLTSLLNIIYYKDILACYFALGCPTEYDASFYSFFNVFTFSDRKKHVKLDYSEYLVFDTLEGSVGYYKKVFDIFKENNKHQAPLLYQLLDGFDKLLRDRYVSIIKELARHLTKSIRPSGQGSRWMEVLIDYPIELLGRDARDYKLFDDEKKIDSIDKEYFDLIEDVSQNLCHFVNSELKNSDALLRIFHKESFFSQLEMPGINFWVEELLKQDIFCCYKKLGHSLNINTIEGKFLFLYLLKEVNFKNVPLDYDGFNKYCDSNSLNGVTFILRDYCTRIIQRTNDDRYSSVDVDSDGFILTYFLDQMNHDICKKYKVLLYRCASIIAKADGRITDTESQWLQQIVAHNYIKGNSVVENTPNEEKTASNSEFKELGIEKNSSEYAEKNPIEELSTLIGLELVKKEVNSLANFIKMKQMRESKGLKAPAVSYHCVFTGNPGTGKTTVARILAEIFKSLGLLKSGHLVETDRSGLVAEYVGQTAVKTNKIIDEALDGVLFVDEAYTLVGGQNDYGNEAIATLLKRMEDDRDRLIVILAGYSDKMEEFIQSNPGLRSRFSRYIYFPDYSPAELFDIFQLNADKNEYTISDDAIAFLKSKLEDVVRRKQADFGNAREVRNYFERAIEHQANRLSMDTNLTTEKLTELTLDDVAI